MAHQDYISRSSNKKSNPYKKKGASEPQGIPLKVKFIALFALLAVGGFAYFLWFLKDVEPTEQATPIPQKTKTAQPSLPKPPEEKWEYIEKLKGQTEIEGGEYEVVNKGPYKMQCGSFRTVKQAETLKANIAFAGLIAQVSKSTGKNGVYYKVFLGPYEKKRDAEKDKHKLKRNNINYCQIWLWR